MKGRKPKPTHLRLLEGNPGKRRINRDDMRPSEGLDAPPEWLSKSQQAGWTYAVEHARPGLLKRIDGSILTVFVVAEDLHRQAIEAINSSGLLAPSPVKAEPMQNLYLAIANKQALIMAKAAAELGFSPSSRSRIPTQAPIPTARSPFAQFRAPEEIQ
jgi:P27 family predicted phage terminase small subunit